MTRMVRAAGLLAAGCIMLFSVLPTIAAEKQTLYNSPYVTFSPDGQAFTTCAGDTDRKWYDYGTRVTTGIRSSLRLLQTGEHYYKVRRSGEIPVGYWSISHRAAQCIHNAYPASGEYHGLPFGRLNCRSYYHSGWMAYCADCGDRIAYINMYMTKEAAESIDYLDLGDSRRPLSYYYLCPYCNNLEQGTALPEHRCNEISWNQYRIVYQANVGDGEPVGGWMQDSYHMYENAQIYEGETVIPQTHLNANTYHRIGYVFTGWNTRADGTGTAYPDESEIHNLSAADWREASTWTATDKGSVTLYAQWRPVRSVLLLDANSGTYCGEKTYRVERRYGERYTPDPKRVAPPKGAKVSFETDGGAAVESVVGKQSFQEWSIQSEYQGEWKDGTYRYLAPDGHTDQLTAQYRREAVVLPAATKEGWSFGGWYYDREGTVPAGAPGDEIVPTEDVTLYARWVDLRLQSLDNYAVRGGSGAVDLSWEQKDQNSKSYLVWQRREGQDWIRVNSSEDISSTTEVAKEYAFEKAPHRYVIPFTGLYELSAQGAQGGNYGTCHGGYGGSVTGTFWLKKGEVLTYTVGGQNGYPEGGTASAFGSGGGSTSIASDQKGVLMIAGGGGGASPAGNGGDGGKNDSLRADSGQGQSGMAGGGGGEHGGTAGEEIRHNHKDSCYANSAFSLNSWTYTGSNHGDMMDPMDCHGVGGYTCEDGDSTMSMTIGGKDGIAIKQNTKMSLAYDMHSWGNTGGLRKKNSYIYVYNQKGKQIAGGTMEAIMAGKASNATWQDTGSYNDPGQWTSSYQVKGNAIFSLPAGTTSITVRIYVDIDGAKAWWGAHIYSLQFSGGRKITCGYTEGQVISSKPAYGGSSYINTKYAQNYTLESGVQSGNGKVSLYSKAIGYQDTLELPGVAAPDLRPPRKITEGIRSVAHSDGSVTICWQSPEDLGTTYYHKVESYLTGSTSKLCESNVTKNTLTSGIYGYGYVIDAAKTTTVKAQDKVTLLPQVTVQTTDTVQYLHIAAVDVAGNIGATTHLPIDAREFCWPIRTRQLEIDDSADNVYPAEAAKTWYVRADGRTPFLLQNGSYLEGEATAEYQPFGISYEAWQGENSVSVYQIETPYAAIRQGTIRTEADALRVTTEGEASLQPYPYSYTLRSNWNRELCSFQKFVLTPEHSGEQIRIVPGAWADRGVERISSDREADAEHGITLIADGEAPVMLGLELLENRELIDRRNGTLKVTVTASDALSGVRDFYIEIRNRDNAIAKTYRPGVRGAIEIVMTEEDPIFSGDFSVVGYAEDNVGNIAEVSFGTTEFGLESTVERILEPHDPVFRCGESGRLVLTTWGYADRVEVIFPENMTSLDPSLNREYDYRDNPGYSVTETLEFMVPLGTPENTNFEITVRAYKDDRKLEEHPLISVIAVQGSVLDELRTRLR